MWQKKINLGKNISNQGVVKHANSCSLGQLLLTIITEPTSDPCLLKPSLKVPAHLSLSHFQHTYFQRPSQAARCILSS